jgi:hypothetical protein
MHTPSRFIAVAGLALLAAACADAGAPTGSVPAADPLLVKLAAAGWDTAGAQDMGDRFIVEGDIGIAKDVVASWPAATPIPGGPMGPKLQWHTTNLVGQTRVYGLKVDLSGLASQPAWQTAARQAMAEWNALGQSAVYLVEGTPADITVRTGYYGLCGIAAEASWPSGQNPGPTITVNTNYCGSPNNSSTKLHNMVHEFGHVLGLRHSNWQARGEVDPAGAIQVPGTPATDASSVMNGGTAANAWAGFSANDRVAVRTLYPRVASVVITDQPLVRVIGSFSFRVHAQAFDANGNFIPYKSYQAISVDDPSIATLGMGSGGSGSLLGVSPGATTVRLSVDGVAASANVDVIAINITGPTSLGWDEQGTYTATVTGPGGPYTTLGWSSGERTWYCDGQLTCTVTGSQLGESYIQLHLRDERNGAYLTNTLTVN